jgi:glycosyltransferase involved in cell wall biosynthesis
MRRLRVLISSHEFCPDKGSECAVGWNISTRLAAFHDVTVLCSDTYMARVNRQFEENGAVSELKVAFVKNPPATLRYESINDKLMVMTNGIGWQALYYIWLDAWHREAFRTAQNLGLENFDVVHQLTPISFRRPGYLWMTPLPFFWGPIGGMVKVPISFARSSSFSSFLFETVRNTNIEWNIRTSRHFRGVVSKASRIWTVTDYERRIVNGLAMHKAVPMIDTAPPPEIIGRVRQFNGSRPLRICWSGHLLAPKSLPLLLDAISQLPEKSKVILDVIGDGPEKQRWKGIAKKLDLSNITWHGRLPYDEALRMMGHADVFVLTSFREAASMVVLEALGWGLPVICHDACGMTIAIDDTCGIKVPFENPKISIQSFCDAIVRILRNPGLVAQLSEGALRKASVLSWDAKVKMIAEAYPLYVK